MEQNVDIPVPGRGGLIAGLQGFPPEQNSTALHVSQERISERIMEQIVDFPFLVAAVKIFAQDRVHPVLRIFQLVFMMSWMSLVKVFFALFFPKIKKCEGHPALECESAPRHQLIHADLSSNGSP